MDLYRKRMKGVVETQPNLDIRQAMVDRLAVKGRQGSRRRDPHPRAFGKTVILTTGTFLRGLIHIGPDHFPAGRPGDLPPSASPHLRELGFEIGRLKTGTTPRLNGRTIDYSGLEIQPGDERPSLFPSPPRDPPVPGPLPHHLHHGKRPTTSSGEAWTALPSTRA